MISLLDFDDRVRSKAGYPTIEECDEDVTYLYSRFKKDNFIEGSDVAVWESFCLFVDRFGYPRRQLGAYSWVPREVLPAVAPKAKVTA